MPRTGPPLSLVSSPFSSSGLSCGIRRSGLRTTAGIFPPRDPTAGSLTTTVARRPTRHLPRVTVIMTAPVAARPTWRVGQRTDDAQASVKALRLRLFSVYVSSRLSRARPKRYLTCASECSKLSGIACSHLLIEGIRGSTWQWALSRGLSRGLSRRKRGQASRTHCRLWRVGKDGGKRQGVMHSVGLHHHIKGWSSRSVIQCDTLRGKEHAGVVRGGCTTEL